MEKEYKTVKISDIRPYPNNPRVNDDAVESVKESIRQCGYIAPMIVDEKMQVLAGHTRLKAMQEMGTEEMEVLVVSGLDEDTKKKYRLLDNKTNEMSAWDFDKLAEELEGLNFEGFDFGFGFDLEETEEEKQQELYDKYSKAVGSVDYEPRGGEHAISDLYTMTDRFDGMIAKIENEELRKMLEIRKAWFCEFNYGAIADYYAGQATAEEQEVFEALGLILLDRDGLIRNGFADLLADLDGLDPATDEDYEDEGLENEDG